MGHLRRDGTRRFLQSLDLGTVHSNSRLAKELTHSNPCLLREYIPKIRRAASIATLLAQSIWTPVERTLRVQSWGAVMVVVEVLLLHGRSNYTFNL